ncbi:MAG TPA: septum formation family protein [Pseudonocardiaceae bacterium]|jgi:hypothetical protein|nr:septum formation family protein [Pseudonocardiaceae bacterium]
MAGVQELRRTSPGGSGTRLYLAGAFVGALILLGSSVFGGWPKVASNPDDPATIAANAAVGTCVTWTKPDATDLSEVDCAQQHLFEVTGAADISGAYPSGAALPDAVTWQRVTQSSCASSATAYLGKLDPNGRYMISALRPTLSQWNDDDRSLRCGLQGSTPFGQPLSTTGSAKGQDQSAVYEVGTCLALNGKAPGGPIGCGQAHAYEIVGIVSLQSKFPNGYPSSDQQQSALGQLCEAAAGTYTKNLNLDQYHLTITWNTIKQESWAAGSYRTNCEIGKPLPDGSGLGPVINSVKGVGPGTSGG